MKFALTSFFALLLVSSYAVTDVLKVKIAGNSYTDETAIRFIQGASPQFDGNFDAWKLFSGNPNVPSIFTKCSSGELSINALGLMQIDTSIDIYVKIPVQGNYTITGDEYGIFNTGNCIMLEDLQTGNYFDLRSTTSYSFSLNASTVNSPARFKVHFRVAAVVTTTDATCFGYNNGSVLIQNNGLINWTYSLNDSLGNNISSNTFNQNINIPNLYSGNYELITSDITGCARTSNFFINQPAQIISDFLISDSIINIGGSVQFTNLSTNATSYQWDFGDASPLSNQVNTNHIYTSTGLFNITLTSTDGACSSSSSKIITVTGLTGLTDNNSETVDVSAYSDGNTIFVSHNGAAVSLITIYDLLGNLVFITVPENQEKTILSLELLPRGILFVEISSQSAKSIFKLYN